MATDVSLTDTEIDVTGGALNVKDGAVLAFKGLTSYGSITAPEINLTSSASAPSVEVYEGISIGPDFTKVPVGKPYSAIAINSVGQIVLLNWINAPSAPGLPPTQITGTGSGLEVFSALRSLLQQVSNLNAAVAALKAR